MIKKITLPILLLASLSMQAKDNISAYLTINNSRNLGYYPGIGARIELAHKESWFGVKAYGELTNEKKINAETGYAYQYYLQPRAYIKSFFAGCEYGRRGYKSCFPQDIHNGAVWEKKITGFNYVFGYYGDLGELEIRICPKENQTANKVSALGINASYNITEKLNGRFSFSISDYIQNSVKGRGFRFTAGLGFSISSKR